MIKIDKTLIKERFAKSINTYNDNAICQNKIAATLVKYIKKHSDHNFTKVLELGAGTGFLTQGLLQNFKIKQLVCNDMVGQYKSILEEKIKTYNCDFQFIESDLEETKNFTDCYDLIASASALQWVLELDKLFEKLSEKVTKNGMFAFSTFGKKNLLEFRNILSRGLFYPDMEMLKNTVDKYFTISDYYEEVITMNFDSPTAVLKHIKYTGVNSLIRSTMTRKKLNEFSAEYNERYRNNDGVSLTYNPIYIIAKKN